MIYDVISKAVNDLSVQLLEEAGIEEEAVKAAVLSKVKIEHPGNPEHGDYSTNAAMQLVKLLKRSPLAIAEQLKADLLKQNAAMELFCRIEVAAPGYVNLFIHWSEWAKLDYVMPKLAVAEHEKVLIEHTSINPNKSAHIGHLRNSCIGDTLARILKKTGHSVEVHNYIDDLGNQLADTVVGLLHTPNTGSYERFGDFCWDTYAAVNRAYKEQPLLAEKRTEVLHELEEGTSNTAWIGYLTAEKIVREHLDEMALFGIQYDVLVWESNIVREGFWSQAFELLRGTAVFHLETEGKLAGCWVLKQGDNFLEEQLLQQLDEVTVQYQEDKVLVRSNGILTYTAKDIAYHLWKFGLLNKDFLYKKFNNHAWSTHKAGESMPFGKATAVINVIDQRQQYPQEMVKQALQALGYSHEASHLKHVSYGVVSLSPATAAGLGIDVSEGKSAYAMSGRQGIGIKVNDFLQMMEGMIDAKRSRQGGISSKAIAAASIRYYLLRFQLQTEVVFDLEQAAEVTGNTGVYLLYAYARACRVLEKGEYGPLESTKAGHPDLNGDKAAVSFAELEAAELALLRKLAYWPETVEAVVKELAPSDLCLYLYELSALFNQLYAACPILKAEEPKRSLRLWITARYEQTMRDGLEMLGLPAPQSM